MKTIVLASTSSAYWPDLSLSQVTVGIVAGASLAYLFYRLYWNRSPQQGTGLPVLLKPVTPPEPVTPSEPVKPPGTPVVRPVKTDSKVASEVTRLKGFRPESDVNADTHGEVRGFLQRLTVVEVEELRGNDHWRQVLENHAHLAAQTLSVELMVAIAGSEGNGLTLECDRAFAKIITALPRVSAYSETLSDRSKAIVEELARRGLPENSWKALEPFVRQLKAAGVSTPKVARRGHATSEVKVHVAAATAFRKRCPSVGSGSQPPLPVVVEKVSLPVDELRSNAEQLRNPKDDAEFLRRLNATDLSSFFSIVQADRFDCVWRALYVGRSGEQPYIQAEMQFAASVAYSVVPPDVIYANGAEDKFWQYIEAEKKLAIDKLDVGQLAVMLQYYRELLQQTPSEQTKDLQRQKEHMAYVEMAFVSMAQATESLLQDVKGDEKMRILTQFCEVIQSEARIQKWGDVNALTAPTETGNPLLDDLLLKVIHGFKLAKKVVESWVCRRVYEAIDNKGAEHAAATLPAAFVAQFVRCLLDHRVAKPKADAGAQRRHQEKLDKMEEACAALKAALAPTAQDYDLKFTVLQAKYA